MADMGPNSEGLNVYQAQGPAPTPKQREDRERQAEERENVAFALEEWADAIEATGLSNDPGYVRTRTLALREAVSMLRTHSPEECVETVVRNVWKNGYAHGHSDGLEQWRPDEAQRLYGSSIAIRQAVARLRHSGPCGEDDIVRELRCEMCGRDYPVWSADSDLWNEVMREPGPEDEYAFVCPTCFTVRAAFMGVETSFRLRRSAPREVVGYGVFGEGDHEELPKRWLVASEGEDGVRAKAEALATCKEYRRDFPQHTYHVHPVGPPIGDEE